jgi:hypothetical protein
MLKNLTALLLFFYDSRIFLLAESRLLLKSSRTSGFLRISLRYYFISLFQFLLVIFGAMVFLFCGLHSQMLFSFLHTCNSVG